MKDIEDSNYVNGNEITCSDCVHRTSGNTCDEPKAVISADFQIFGQNALSCTHNKLSEAYVENEQILNYIYSTDDTIDFTINGIRFAEIEDYDEMIVLEQKLHRDSSDEDIENAAKRLAKAAKVKPESAKVYIKNELSELLPKLDKTEGEVVYRAPVALLDYDENGELCRVETLSDMPCSELEKKILARKNSMLIFGTGKTLTRASVYIESYVEKGLLKIELEIDERKRRLKQSQV